MYEYQTTIEIDGIEVDVTVHCETDLGEPSTRDCPGSAPAAYPIIITRDDRDSEAPGWEVPETLWPADIDDDATERWLEAAAEEYQGRIDDAVNARILARKEGER